MSPLIGVDLESSADESGLRLEHAAFPLEIGGLRFSTGEADRADWQVETFDVKRTVRTRAPRARRILVLTEPGTDLPAGYVNQFGILLGPRTVRGFSGIFHQSHGALPAGFARDVSLPGHAAVYSYEELVALRPPAKRNAIAVVVSRKTLLPGHRRRLRFLRRLKAALGDRLDIYGDGLNKIPLKADAILPYKYHLVLENTAIASYWTEKLADAYLGFAFPLVSGPPDLARWFPAESFRSLDLDRPAEAVRTIVQTMDEDIYDRRFQAIVEARTRVLRDERLCPLIARVIALYPDNAPLLAAPETIHPAPRAAPLRRVVREIGRAYWQAAERTCSLFAGRG